MTSDPVRLLEDPSAGTVLRSDLVHAAEAELQGLDFAAGLAALQKATATVTSSTTVVAGTSLLTKLGIGAAGVAVGAVALWLGLGGGEGPAAPSGDALVRAAKDGPEAGDGERVAPPAVVSAPELDVDEPSGGPGARAFDGGAAPVRVEATPEAPQPAKIETVGLEPEPKLDPEAEGAEAEPDRETKPTPSSRRKGATGDRSSGEKPGTEPGDRPSGASEAPTDSVLREAKLVAKARRNLARDPARALALAEEAERDFPQGQLVEERRAIAIRALVALGRRDEAQRLAEPFLAEYGRGAHAAAVRRALEDDTEAP